MRTKGKSNLIRALQLILDPGLSERDRQLGLEHFWDGLCADKLGEAIEISDILTDFTGDRLMAHLNDCVIDPVRPAINATHADPNAGDFDHYSPTHAASHAICAQTYVIVVQGMISEEIFERLGVSSDEDAPIVGGGLTGFIGPNGSGFKNLTGIPRQLSSPTWTSRSSPSRNSLPMVLHTCRSIAAIPASRQRG